MKERTAIANWHGELETGKGNILFGDGRFSEPYTADSRFGDAKETNPEELIAAAHAACYSMALSAALGENGKKPVHIETKAIARIEKKGDGFVIPSITLHTEAKVPDIEESEFQEIAEDTKNNCPVSKALATCDIRLEAKLV